MAHAQRLISHSEIETAYTCQARWDFSYGGRLAGDALKSRSTAAILSEGKAWGAAAATWHATGDRWKAHEAMSEALASDAQRATAAGGILQPVEERREQFFRLAAILDHYMATAPRLSNLTRLEDEMLVPIPGRKGGTSNRYRLLGYLDGFTVEESGLRFAVEFKLRGRLTDPTIIPNSAQLRDYVWALQHLDGEPVAGIILDECLNEAPKPAKIVKAKRKADGVGGRTVSHDKAQLTTPDLYEDACRQFGVEPEEETLEALRGRLWRQRFTLMLRPSEVHEAGLALVSAAKLIAKLDSGEIWPVRNASPRTCGGCRFRQICSHPGDRDYVDTLFERVAPKRDRDPNEREAR